MPTTSTKFYNTIIFFCTRPHVHEEAKTLWIPGIPQTPETLQTPRTLKISRTPQTPETGHYRH